MKEQPLRARLAHYGTILDAVAAAPADNPFVVSYHPEAEPSCRELTFGDFFDLSSRLRSLYQELGLSAGETVALMMQNGPLVMAGFVAAMELGAVPTILAYPTFKVEPEKYRHGLTGVTGTIGPRLVLVDEDYPAELAEVIQADVRVVREDGLPPPSLSPARQAANADSIALLQHSAGTTGLQKGVALPHRAVLNQIVKLADTLLLSDEDRIVSWLPLYHDMGLVACFVLPLVCHLPVVMMSPTDWILHPEIFLQLADRYRATVGWLPNFAFQFMARRVSEKSRAGIDLSSLRLLISTSEPIRAASFDEFQAVFAAGGLAPTVLQTSYGMAENTFAVTQSRIGAARPPRTVLSRRRLLEKGRVDTPETTDDRLELVSCGQPLPGCRVEIVNPVSREPVADGVVGELKVKSDCLFDGYFRRPELTADALDRDGWYHTGDLGFRQGEDFYVMGRRDDVVIVGGRNIFPEDAESAAARHPAIRDGRVVAFGVENDSLGTRDLIVVAELHGEPESRAEIAGWIREEILAELGIAPRQVHLVEPGWVIKSTAGKPARSTNRSKWLAEQERRE